MTLEEACLILSIQDKTQLKKDFILKRYDEAFIPTKDLSPYMADKIEGAKSTLMEELNLR